LHVSYWDKEVRDTVRQGIESHEKISICDEVVQYQGSELHGEMHLYLTKYIRGKERNTAPNQVMGLHATWRVMCEAQLRREEVTLDSLFTRLRPWLLFDSEIPAPPLLPVAGKAIERPKRSDIKAFRLFECPCLVSGPDDESHDVVACKECLRQVKFV
jgi:hypothetical protein